MRIPVSVILCLLASLAFSAEVYRSVDENGVVVYSDRPEGESPELVFVATRAGTARQAQAPRAAAAGSDAGPEVLSGEILEQSGGPSATEIAAERDRNCTIARERAERYAVSHRLFRNLPNGEREYLSDTEIDEARAEAQADVANWCS